MMLCMQLRLARASRQLCCLAVTISSANPFNWSQFLDDVLGAAFSIMVGGQNEGSSCSTAASEHSSESGCGERRKRSSPSDEAASFKPYECRFCPMKFAKSQALGGHMNRHRQEREREQVMNARRLLMQQDFSTMMIPGPNSPSALPKFNQTHLQRSVSEGSLKDVTRMGMPQLQGASACRGSGMQSNPYNSSIGTSYLSTITENSPASTLDGMIPQFQSRPAYGSLLTNDPSSYMLQQPANRLAGGHNDMMLSFPYDKVLQGSIFQGYESNPHGMQRSNSMPASQGLPNQSEAEGGILTATPDLSQHLMSSNRLLINHGSSSDSAKRGHQLSLQPQQVNLSGIGSGGLQYYSNSYSTTDAATRSSINHSLDFNIGSSCQLDGYPWLLGNFKTAPALTSDDYRQEVDATVNPKLSDSANINSPSSGQCKAARWDLALPRTDDHEDTEERIRDVTPVTDRAASLPFGVDNYAHGSTSDIEEGTYSQESKVSK